MAACRNQAEKDSRHHDNFEKTTSSKPSTVSVIMEQWQTTLISYAALGAVGYTTYWYYTKDKRPRTDNRAARASEAKAENDARVARERRRREKSRAQSKKTDEPVFPLPQASQPESKEKSDDRAFAEMMSTARKGTKFGPSSNTQQARVKTFKQSAIGKAERLSGNSSSNGGEEEGSSTTSPILGATSAKNVTSGVDVSDMLEAPAPGPASLRITPSTKPEQPAKQKKEKKVQETESKKQRQQRQKKEAEREELAKAESVRREQLEKHLKAARDDERRRGERASNNGTVYASKPASNAWTSAPAVKPSESAPLLDTIQDGGVSNNSSDATTSPVSNATSTNWDRALPSEEEQMRRLMEQDDSSWTTVPKGRKGKKKANGINGDSDSKENTDPEPKTPEARQIEKPSYFPTNGIEKDADWSVV
ncbi:hypothetical protein K402DRAFT_418636 [Aulographum hederae CBS 113979]|uniref:Uncharacterized protein n=1 Tax=Aulographum hederae CBS 113979 TaxID=1176131 RepID=A0A6G1H810_9PEZI|nr:hypothetical protein K402DRAFT_418636 [Aulographum hederae CBS 113979]